MKLEEGMYVRTKKRMLQPSQIARIRNMSKDSGYKNQYYIELDKNLIPSYEYHIYQEDILKASHSIVDLIQVGDYVNGERVVYINHKYEYLEVSDEAYIIKKEDIKSIVTKEQFESMEYKLGSDK